MRSRKQLIIEHIIQDLACVLCEVRDEAEESVVHGAWSMIYHSTIRRQLIHYNSASYDGVDICR